MLTASLLEYAAIVVRSEPRRAARLAGAAIAVRRRLGGQLPAMAREIVERTRRAAGEVLGVEAAEREWEAGGRLTMEDAVAEAGGAGYSSTEVGTAGLSRREAQVAELVAQGLTNREIADALHLSERTVENHTSHVLHKLGLRNRPEVTAWVLSRARGN